MANDNPAPIAWHVVSRLGDDRVIATSAPQRRVLARIVYEQGRVGAIVAFRLADTHLHVLIAGPRRIAGTFARRAEGAIRKRLRIPVAFAPARFKPILDQGHLYSSFRYVLRQEARHGTCQDPFHDASSLPELVGIRRLDHLAADRVAAMLPRLSADELACLFGPLDGADKLCWCHLPEAAASAAGIDDVRARGRAASAARRAAIHVGHAGGLSSNQLAAMFKRSQRCIQQQCADHAEPLVEAYIMGQLRLRSRLMLPSGPAP